MIPSDDLIAEAARALGGAAYGVAFTGAGISVESGIPPYRGPGGLWEQADPEALDYERFAADPSGSWPVIKRIYYDRWGRAEPNAAHYGVAALEHAGIVRAVITQNIDNLHQEAGSQDVCEFHGNMKWLVCVRCGHRFPFRPELLESLPVTCPACGGPAKPDFVFFGEGIPAEAYRHSVAAAQHADVFLVIGTSGEVMPACMIPFLAHEEGARIIEINIADSQYTHTVTDLFLMGRAGEVVPRLLRAMGLPATGRSAE